MRQKLPSPEAGGLEKSPEREELAGVLSDSHSDTGPRPPAPQEGSCWGRGHRRASKADFLTFWTSAHSPTHTNAIDSY